MPSRDLPTWIGISMFHCRYLANKSLYLLELYAYMHLRNQFQKWFQKWRFLQDIPLWNGSLQLYFCTLTIRYQYLPMSNTNLKRAITFPSRQTCFPDNRLKSINAWNIYRKDPQSIDWRELYRKLTWSYGNHIKCLTFDWLLC